MSYRKHHGITVPGLFLLTAATALAQETEQVTEKAAEEAAKTPPPPLWTDLMTTPTTLLWGGIALVACYVLSVILTMTLVNRGYPPNVARLGCWVGLAAWLLFFGFVLFGAIHAVQLPVWMQVVVGLLVALSGLVFFLSRRHPA